MKKLTVTKKTVKKISDEDLRSVGGGKPQQGEKCTATCTGHWESYSPNCTGTCKSTKS